MGLKAERIEDTQGESDVLVFAQYCEEPYGVVIECQAKEGGGQVGSEKIGQVRSHFSRYLSRFTNASKVFRCLVGRPNFSIDCVKDSKGTSSDEDSGVGVCLLSACDITRLVHSFTEMPLSQEDMRMVFSKDGPVSSHVNQIVTDTDALLACYGAILAIAEAETRDSGRTVTRLDRTQFVGQVLMLLRVSGYGPISPNFVTDTMTDLSSPLVDLLRLDDSTVRRTSHKIGRRLANLGGGFASIDERYSEMRETLDQGDAAAKGRKGILE